MHCVIVTTKDPAPHNMGIVSLDKGVLVKPEAPLIESATCHDGEPRFVQVAYATDEAKDDDTTFIFANETGGATYYGNNDFTAYDGYAQVFDLETGAYVDGV